MAIVEFNRSDLEKLVGRRLSDSDYSNAIPMIGAPLEAIDNKSVLFEVFPNRPDMLSIEGFSRAIRAFLGSASGPKPGAREYKTKKGSIVLKVDPSVKAVRPYVTAAVLRNVKMSDELVTSLMQLQEKIHDTFGRKRRKIAIGVHDMDRVKSPFTYKAVDPDATAFVPLDMSKKMTMRDITKKHPKGIGYGHILEQAKKWPLITDSKGDVLSFPPIINGELTRVTDRTKSLFIDVTGTSEQAVEQALNIIVSSIADRGATIESVLIVEAGKKKERPDMKPRKMAVDINYVSKILGINIGKPDFRRLAEKMGFSAEVSSSSTPGYVMVPCYRTDIMHQIDIAEDIAIAYGYMNFKPEVPAIPTIAKPLADNEKANDIKNIMCSLGFQEVVTMTLSNEDDEFVKMCEKPKPVARTLNPLTVECTICRRELMPSLLDVLSQNLHVEYPQKIFELGNIIELDSRSETGARNAKRLCCLISRSDASYEDASSALDAFMRSVGVQYQIKATAAESFIPGRAGSIIVGNKNIGIIGELHPRVLSNWKIEKPAAGFELDMSFVL